MGPVFRSTVDISSIPRKRVHPDLRRTSRSGAVSATPSSTAPHQELLHAGYGAPAWHQVLARSPAIWEDPPATNKASLSRGVDVLRLDSEAAPGASAGTSMARPSAAFSAAVLKGKRVNHPQVQGVLSDWSLELPAEVVAGSMFITFDEATGLFDCSQEARQRTSAAHADELRQKRHRAMAFFETFGQKKGVLGMAGKVRGGPEDGLIPETTAEKMSSTRQGAAASGPIHSYLNERSTGFLKAPKALSMLGFDYLGADDTETNVFYFEQPGVSNPKQSGHLKWRLTCFVDRVWKSAAPRAYGPSRTWGGAWGGASGTAGPFKNDSSLNQPGNAAVVGGIWEKLPRFIMHVIDEIPDKDESGEGAMPSPRASPIAGSSPLASLPFTPGTMPAFQSSRRVPFQRHEVPRTFCGGKVP